jgi:hypothetical protein
VSRLSLSKNRDAGRYIASVTPSLIGLILLIGLSLDYSSPTFSFQREISSLAFIIICVFGAVAGIFPSQMRNPFNRTPKRDEAGPGHLGHHPACGRFETHVLRVRGKILCAGCAGLTIGAVVAIILSLYSLFYPIQVPSLIILVAGVILTTLGIFQHVLSREPRIHLALNVALVTGVAISRIGANQLNGGIALDAYTLALSLYLIIVRIDLSRDDHAIICTTCFAPCEYSYATNRNLSISDE